MSSSVPLEFEEEHEDDAFVLQPRLRIDGSNVGDSEEQFQILSEYDLISSKENLENIMLESFRNISNRYVCSIYLHLNNWNIDRVIKRKNDGDDDNPLDLFTTLYSLNEMIQDEDEKDQEETEGELIEGKCCVCEKDSDNLIGCPECDNQVCLNCIVLHIYNEIEDKNVVIRCFGEECEMVLDYESIELICAIFRRSSSKNNSSITNLQSLEFNLENVEKNINENILLSYKTNNPFLKQWICPTCKIVYFVYIKNLDNDNVNDVLKKKLKKCKRCEEEEKGHFHYTTSSGSLLKNPENYLSDIHFNKWMTNIRDEKFNQVMNTFQTDLEKAIYLSKQQHRRIRNKYDSKSKRTKLESTKSEPFFPFQFQKPSTETGRRNKEKEEEEVRFRRSRMSSHSSSSTKINKMKLMEHIKKLQEREKREREREEMEQQQQKDEETSSSTPTSLLKFFGFKIGEFLFSSKKHDDQHQQTKQYIPLLEFEGFSRKRPSKEVEDDKKERYIQEHQEKKNYIPSLDFDFGSFRPVKNDDDKMIWIKQEKKRYIPVFDFSL